MCINYIYTSDAKEIDSIDNIDVLFIHFSLLLEIRYFGIS